MLELLVVVSVIALLMGIVLPSFSRAREQSKRTKCLANLHAISQGLQAHLNENEDYFPEAARVPTLQPDVPAIQDVLDRQMGGSRTVYECPADRIIKEKVAGGPETYFEREGTSYEWNEIFNHVKVTRAPDPFYLIAGFKYDARTTAMMYDYEPYHGGETRIGSVNTVYGDLSVASDKADLYKGPGE